MHAARTAEAASPARGVKRSAADDADGEQQRLSKRFGTMTLGEFPPGSALAPFAVGR